MNNIAIISNPIKDEDLAIAKKLKEKGEALFPDMQFSLFDIDEASPQDVKDAQCILALGGDGSMLSISKKMSNLNIPILGVNLGTLGFLAEVEITDIEKTFKALHDDNYHIEERMMLSGQVVCNGKVICQEDALNDVVISRRGDLQVIGYRIIVNGLYLNDFFADGVIISTPTGSTGYNMSAGGSIVEPSARLIVLTPVCPHTLSNRSIILSASDNIEVQILEGRGNRKPQVGAYFDGGQGQVLGEGDAVKVFTSERCARVLKLSHMSFLETLHAKMNP